MGIHTLVGAYDGSETEVCACMVDSVTGKVFGPLFREGDVSSASELVDDFLAYCRAHGNVDPREMGAHTLEAQYDNWRNALCAKCETTSCGGRHLPERGCDSSCSCFPKAT